MKNYKTKYALVTSFVALFLCVSMLMGTTYAWFTDSVASANNTIVAGNLDVELDYWKGNDWEDVQGKSDLFDPEALWEPGHTEVVYLRVSNVGSLAFKYLLSINVAEEKIGRTVAGENIQLSKYIKYGIVTDNVSAGMFDGDRAAAIEAVDEPRPISELISNIHNFGNFDGQILAEGAPQYVALVVWMPTEVGNEANHNGKDVPYIKLGVNLTATQYTDEVDSFDKYYDEGAIFVTSGRTTVTIEPNPTYEAAGYNVQIRNQTDTAKIGALEIPATALKDGATDFEVVYEESARDSRVPVADDEDSVTYEIAVTNLKENNNVPIKVQIRVPKGKDPATVKAYHEADPIDSNYNPHEGYVSLETTSFSPFTVVFDPDSVYVDPKNPTDLPQANVTPYTPTEDIEWQKYGDWSPVAGLEANLDAIYKFSCAQTPEEAAASRYATWYCDFYVSLDRDLGENEIFLGGNYGSFGWVGFHNREVTLAANTELPLLGSVTSNPWTYEDIVDFVGTFICGVGNVKNPETNVDSLVGATFTVKLRLTNPENANEYYDVSTITYKFQ